VSDRGERTRLSTYRQNFSMLRNPSLNQTDIFRVKPGDTHAERITSTDNRTEMRPQVTRDGNLFFISDENGIQNIFVMNIDTREVAPITNLLSGIMQMSLSQDGPRMAHNSINGGYLVIFLIQTRINRKKEEKLEPNTWALYREVVSDEGRVP